MMRSTVKKPRVRKQSISDTLVHRRNSAALKFRGDTTAAHNALWQHLKTAGLCFDAHEKLAIARETRLARDCTVCLGELADGFVPLDTFPTHNTGEQDEKNNNNSKEDEEEKEKPSIELDEAVVEVIHRVVNMCDQVNIDWYKSVIHKLSTTAKNATAEEYYLETLSIVTALVAHDVIYEALQLKLRALPVVDPEEASRPPLKEAFPEHRKQLGTIERSPDMWIPFIRPSEALGKAKQGFVDLYDLVSEKGLAKKTDVTIGCTFSVVPKELFLLKVLGQAWYVPFQMVVASHAMPNFRVLERSQVEFIAASVSKLRECSY